MMEQETTPDAPAHTPGTSKGEGKAKEEGKEGGRDTAAGRTARDSTSINPEAAAPIDPQMPDMPPA